MSKKPPPPRPKHRGQVEAVYRAMYSYTAARPDELSFEEGDVMYVIEKGSDGWWKARVKGNEGLVPYNYVSESAETIDNPMHEAAKRSNVGFLQECIGNKVSVNGLDKAGSTPLHWAAQVGSMECCNLLLAEPRIQINVQNKLGDTPLHSASWKGHADVVDLLLSKGADRNIKNEAKKTPYELARQPDVAALLKPAVKGSASTLQVDDDDSD